MSIYQFRLPDVGEGVTEAEIAEWHVKAGDRVQQDAPLIDVTTDKALVDITSPVGGLVTATHGKAGEKVPVGAILVEFELAVSANALDSIPANCNNSTLPSSGPASVSAPRITGDPQDPKSEASDRPSLPPLASPATRHQAKERGISLDQITPTGRHGQVTQTDLEDFIAKSAALKRKTTVVAPPAGVVEVNIIGIRRLIAEKMQTSKRRIPHFTYVEEFDVTEVEALRRHLNASAGQSQPKLTPLAFFMRALVCIIPDFPYVNARFDDERGVLHQYHSVHMGIATQTADGLKVPVVRHAESLDLWGSAQQISRVTTAARSGTAGRDELTGSSITLTSLGALGGIAATPIINHPEVAIIGPNKMVERPVVLGGRIVIRTMMNLSASFDHRIVDGHDGARFVQALKQQIEQPAALFLTRQ